MKIPVWVDELSNPGVPPVWVEMGGPEPPSEDWWFLVELDVRINAGYDLAQMVCNQLVRFMAQPAGCSEHGKVQLRLVVCAGTYEEAVGLAEGAVRRAIPSVGFLMTEIPAQRTVGRTVAVL